jgi:hypothetical protein
VGRETSCLVNQFNNSRKGEIIMKNTIKRMVTVIVALALLMTLIPAESASAATAKPAKTTLKKVTQTVLSDNSEYIKLTATWKKVAKNTKGYRVKFTNLTTGKVNIGFSYKQTTLTASRKVKASNGDKIKVTVEAYNTNVKTGNKTYSKVSKAKTITIKGMPTAAEAKKNASTTTTTVSTDTTTSETSGTSNKNTTTNYTKDPSTCSHTNVTTSYEEINYPAKSIKVTQAGYDWAPTIGSPVGGMGSQSQAGKSSAAMMAKNGAMGAEDKALLVKEAQENVANIIMPNGMNVTEKGAVFENVTLVAGYSFPVELFYPRTYNGQEVRFWDQKWLEENPEVTKIMKQNKKNYGLMKNGEDGNGTELSDVIPNFHCVESLNHLIYNLTFNTGASIWHLPTNTDLELGIYGPNYNGITYGREATTVLSSSYWRTEHVVVDYGLSVYEDVRVWTVNQDTQQEYFKNLIEIGNEMLWDYFRPGVAHEYGADFTVDVNKTYEFNAYSDLIQTDTCKDCGTVTKNESLKPDLFVNNLPSLPGSGWKADSITEYGTVTHKYYTVDEFGNLVTTNK